MFQGLIPLLVIGAAIFAIFRRRSHQPDGGLGRPLTTQASSTAVASITLPNLDEWTNAGLITSDQAAAISAFEASKVAVTTHEERPSRRVPVVAEALGYLGGILGIVGLVMLIARYWQDMAGGVRLAVALIGLALAAAAGALVRVDGEAALLRLRWFLWLVATAAAGVAGGVIVHDLMGRDAARQESQVALGVALAVTFVSAGLWALRERPVQQATMLGGAAVAIGCAATQWWSNGPSGLLVAAFGVMVIIVWLWLSVPSEAVGLPVGAIVTVAGAGMATDEWMGAGSILLVVSASACVVTGALIAHRRGESVGGTGLADRLRSAGPTGLVIVGSVAMLQAVPMATVHFADDAAIATGSALWCSGAVLLVLVDRLHLRYSVLVGAVGGLGLIVGPAVTAGDSTAFATMAGLATALGAVVLGTMPGRVLLLLVGSVGLLVYVPWSIAHFFPGEDRAPLLIAASGVVIVAVAVLVARSASRVRAELGSATAR